MASATLQSTLETTETEIFPSFKVTPLSAVQLRARRLNLPFNQTEEFKDKLEKLHHLLTNKILSAAPMTETMTVSISYLELGLMNPVSVLPTAERLDSFLKYLNFAFPGVNITCHLDERDLVYAMIHLKLDWSETGSEQRCQRELYNADFERRHKRPLPLWSAFR